MTLTVWFYRDALVINESTIVDRNVEDPTNVLAVIILSPAYGSYFVLSLLAEEAVEDIDENMSGAPLPNASKVTPASDYDILNFTVMYSKEEER